jgi:hypothetical protein
MNHSSIGLLGINQKHFAFNPMDNLVEPFAGLQVREGKWPLSTHFSSIALHHAEVSANIGRKVDFVDN